ncbi:hypothetical protein [Myxococcus faecalis]|uniref:hypothetical protein n=1 Tax=Myxococcus faecalis TaxID=3115646 RepID=UPI003CFABC81
MSRRKTLGEIKWPDDATSRRLAISWANSIVEQALKLVWQGFDIVYMDNLKDAPDLVEAHPEQLERELTQWHYIAIERAHRTTTDGFQSFYPIHEPHEFLSRKGGNAMPPSYDIGFIHTTNMSWILPVEAKLLWSSEALSEYLKDVNEKYATGVAAPQVGECGMIGYLLKGTVDNVFAGLTAQLGQALEPMVSFEGRAHRTTTHQRLKAPALRVHHMVMSCVSPQTKKSRHVVGRRRAAE